MRISWFPHRSKFKTQVFFVVHKFVLNKLINTPRPSYICISIWCARNESFAPTSTKKSNSSVSP